MHLEGRVNYHQIFEPTYLRITGNDGKEYGFQPPKKIDRNFLGHLEDFVDLDEIRTYKLSTYDIEDRENHPDGVEVAAFHYLVHPGMKAIIVPPNAFELPASLLARGISGEVQKFLESLAHRMGYRLIVGITPESAAAFRQRVVNILRNLGYYMGPPSEKKGVYFGEHQSTYQGEGIPEIGTQNEYMLPPTIH